MILEKTIGGIRYIFVKDDKVNPFDLSDKDKDRVKLFVRSGVMKAKDFGKNMESFMEEFRK